MPQIRVKTHSGGGLAAPTVPGDASLVAKLPDTPCKALARIAYNDVYKVHLVKILKGDKHPEWLNDGYKKRFYESSIWDYVRNVVADNAVEFNQNKNDIIKIAVDNPANFSRANWNALLLKTSINRMFDDSVVPEEEEIDKAAKLIRESREYGKYWTNAEQTISDVKLYSKTLKLTSLIWDIRQKRLYEQIYLTFDNQNANKACFENYSEKNEVQLASDASLRWNWSEASGVEPSIHTEVKFGEVEESESEKQKTKTFGEKDLSIKYLMSLPGGYLKRTLSFELNDNSNAFSKMLYRRLIRDVELEDGLWQKSDFFQNATACLISQKNGTSKEFVNSAKKVLHSRNWVNDEFRLAARVRTFGYNRDIVKTAGKNDFLIFPKWEFDKLAAVADNVKATVAKHKLTKAKIESFAGDANIVTVKHEKAKWTGDDYTPEISYEKVKVFSEGGELREIFMKHLAALLRKKFITEEFRKESLDSAIIDFRDFQFKDTFISPFSILLMRFEDCIKQHDIKGFDDKKFFKERMKVGHEVYGMVLPCVKNVILKSGEDHSKEIEQTVNKVVKAVRMCIDDVYSCCPDEMKSEDKEKINNFVERAKKDLKALSEDLTEFIKNSAEVLWLNGTKLDAEVEKRFFEKFPELRWNEKEFTFGGLSGFLKKVSEKFAETEKEYKTVFNKLQTFVEELQNILWDFYDSDYYKSLKDLNSLLNRADDISCNFKSPETTTAMKKFVKDIKNCIKRNSEISENALKAEKEKMREFDIMLDEGFGIKFGGDADKLLDEFVSTPLYSPYKDERFRGILEHIQLLLETPTQNLWGDLRTDQRVGVAYLRKIWNCICKAEKNGNLCVWDESEPASKVFQQISDYIKRNEGNKEFRPRVLVSENFESLCYYSDNGEAETYPGFFKSFCKELHKQAENIYRKQK